MKYFWAIICIFTILSACKDKNDNTVEEAKRTVIIYMSAENNLSSYADSDINEIQKGAKHLPDNVNLIAFIDKADQVTPPYIACFNKNGEINIAKEAEEDFYSSDPAMMHDILGWIMENYPAKSYGLVLWGHANGWIISKDTIPNNYYNNKKRAYGGDTGTNSPQSGGRIWLNIPSMAKMLERLPHRFKFILADCCNFQCAEVAYELRNTTEYIIGSPAEIPGYGAPYDKIIPHLFEESDLFHKQIVDNYFNHYNTGEECVPLSVIKTSEMGNLATATKSLIPYLMENEINTDTTVYYYGRPKVMFDIKDIFRQNIKDKAEYEKWLKTLNEAVIYKRYSQKWETVGLVSFNDFNLTDESYGGMSMFIPMETYDKYINNHWNQGITQMEWYYATGLNNFQIAK